MSFLDDVKSQIISSVYKNVCCRRALLNGVVFAKGEASGKDVSISLENTECIDFVSGLIKEFFGKEPLVFAPPKGGRRKIVSFSSPALSKYLDSVSPGGELYQRKCQGCDQAFLRGVFIASGRASDPSKQYRIEFAKSSDTVRLREHLLSHGLDFSFATRRGESILYTSNSVTCEDFFAEIGLNSTAFKLMNAKIENQFKNEANRVTNCETHNIMKTVSASHRWVEAIEALEKANLLSNLPEELENTARLRLKFKDYSLARLASEFTPPISKPGLSHRLNRIVLLSEVLLGENKK